MATFLGYDIVVPYLIRPVVRTFQSETLSLKRSILELDAQRWHIRFQLRPDPRGDQMAKVAAHRALQRFNAFDISLPGHYKAGANANLVAVGTSNRGQRSLDARSSFGTHVLPAGAFFKIGNDQKVYMLADAVIVRTTETTTLRFAPSLREAVSSNIAIAFRQETPMRMRYSPDAPEEYEYGQAARATIELEEVL